MFYKFLSLPPENVNVYKQNNLFDKYQNFFGNNIFKEDFVNVIIYWEWSVVPSDYLSFRIQIFRNVTIYLCFLSQKYYQFSQIL